MIMAAMHAHFPHIILAAVGQASSQQPLWHCQHLQLQSSLTWTRQGCQIKLLWTRQACQTDQQPARKAFLIIAYAATFNPHQHMSMLYLAQECYHHMLYHALQATWNITIIAPDTTTAIFVTDCVESNRHVQHLPLHLQPWTLGIPDNYTAHHFKPTERLAPADVTFTLQYSQQAQ